MKISNSQIDSYIQKISQEKIAGCLIYGPENSIVNYRFNLIAKKICSDLSDPFLVANINKERLLENKGILAEEFFSFSMLGGRKLILVKDCDSSISGSIKELFSDHEFAKKSDNFILIEAGDLEKSSVLRKLCEESQNFAAIACYEDDERSVKTFIENELKIREIKFTRDMIDFIYEKLGKNRQIIISELEKILVFLGENKNLTINLLAQVIELQAETSANEFVLNFAAKKFDIAITQSEKLLKEGFEAITLIRFLSNYLQKIYQAKSDIEFGGVNFEDAVRGQKLFFKTEVEFRKHLKINSLEDVKKILLNLIDIEIKIKSSAMPSRLLFSDFVSRLIN